MRVAVLGSGSRGNAIAFQADATTLLVDAGFGPRALERRAREADLTLDTIVGIALTHEHGDHARGAAALAVRHGCPVLASPGTLRGLSLAHVETIPLRAHEPSVVGRFSVEAARISHDASEPVALAVTGPAGGKVGVAYDLGRATAAVRYLLRGCQVLILEANHDEMLLRTGPYPPVVRHRISGSAGHLSNRAAAELAADLVGPDLEAVILVHVSEQCNRADLARETVGRALAARGYRGRLLVAKQDAPLPAVSIPQGAQLALNLPEPPPPR